MAKLITIEGTDGAGKQTQTALLAKKLTECGYRVRTLSYPCYDSNSSALVKMYLSGEFGTNPAGVNKYAASLFYAVDRFASYSSDWYKDYNDPNCVILSDRYVGSNAIHQGGKCPDDSSLYEYLDWLEETEYKKMGIPKPDLTFWLEMGPDISNQMMENRKNKFTNDVKKDIHEADAAYLRKCFATGSIVANYWGWKRIVCAGEGRPRLIEEIAADIFAQSITLIQ